MNTQQTPREAIPEADALGFAVMEHLGPASLTGGTMSILQAFALGWRARDAHTAAALAASNELAERLKLEAKIHAGEARGANHTIAEIYQLCTGATGEPGNWNGAEPVRAALAAKDAEIARLRDALELIILWNRDHANDQYGDPDKAESWACIKAARAALTGADHE